MISINNLVLVFLFLAVDVVVRGQLPADSEHPAPEPYSFSFESNNDDGTSSAREETGDQNGRVTGFYVIRGLDGQDRRVDYYADETGFHAEVSTSEIGTLTSETADAVYRSSAPSIAELIAQWAAQGGSSTRVSSQTSTSLVAPPARPVFVQPSRAAAITSTSTLEESRSSTSGQQAPDGFVLVPAAAARQVGLSGVTVASDQLTGVVGSTGGTSSTITRTSGSRTVTTSGTATNQRLPTLNRRARKIV